MRSFEKKSFKEDFWLNLEMRRQITFALERSLELNLLSRMLEHVASCETLRKDKGSGS